MLLTGYSPESTHIGNQKTKMGGTVQKISYIDDIDGTGNAQTVRFGFEGREYEIDLSPRNRQRFLKMVSGYVAHAHKPGTASRTRAAASQAGSGQHRPRTALSRARSREIREWAVSPAGRAALGGLPVSERGRIPVSIVAAYESRDRAPEPAAAPAMPQPPAGNGSPAAGRSGPRNGNGKRGRKPARESK